MEKYGTKQTDFKVCAATQTRFYCYVFSDKVEHVHFKLFSNWVLVEDKRFDDIKICCSKNIHSINITRKIGT